MRESFVASAWGDPPQFVERPGICEFSGQMIVRPLQTDELRERGIEADTIDAIRQRVVSRLAPHTIEYVRGAWGNVMIQAVDLRTCATSNVVMFD